MSLKSVLPQQDWIPCVKRMETGPLCLFDSLLGQPTRCFLQSALLALGGPSKTAGKDEKRLDTAQVNPGPISFWLF